MDKDDQVISIELLTVVIVVRSHTLRTCPRRIVPDEAVMQRVSVPTTLESYLRCSGRCVVIIVGSPVPYSIK